MRGFADKFLEACYKGSRPPFKASGFGFRVRFWAVRGFSFKFVLELREGFKRPYERCINESPATASLLKPGYFELAGFVFWV